MGYENRNQEETDIIHAIILLSTFSLIGFVLILILIYI